MRNKYGRFMKGNVPGIKGKHWNKDSIGRIV